MKTKKNDINIYLSGLKENLLIYVRTLQRKKKRMKITLEEEIYGKERTSICIYTDDGDLIASYWLNKEDDAYRIMQVVKGIVETLKGRFGI